MRLIEYKTAIIFSTTAFICGPMDVPSQNMQSQAVRKHVVASGFLHKLQSRFAAARRTFAVPGREAAIGARGISIPAFDEDIRPFQRNSGSKIVSILKVRSARMQ
jgi:hypothetical protein